MRQPRFLLYLLTTLFTVPGLAQQNSQTNQDLSSMVANAINYGSTPFIRYISHELSLPEQDAARGANTLLTIAKNHLTAEQIEQLSEFIPLIDSSSLNSNISKANLASVLGEQGLSTGTEIQLIAAINGYLQAQGANETLIKALNQAWTGNNSDPHNHNKKGN